MLLIYYFIVFKKKRKKHNLYLFCYYSAAKFPRVVRSEGAQPPGDLVGTLLGQAQQQAGDDVWGGIQLQHHIANLAWP